MPALLPLRLCRVPDPNIPKKFAGRISQHSAEIVFDALHRLVVRRHSGSDQSEGVRIPIENVNAATRHEFHQVFGHVEAGRPTAYNREPVVFDVLDLVLALDLLFELGIVVLSEVKRRSFLSTVAGRVRNFAI